MRSQDQDLTQALAQHQDQALKKEKYKPLNLDLVQSLDLYPVLDQDNDSWTPKHRIIIFI